MNKETLDDFKAEAKSLVRYLKDVIGYTSQKIADALNNQIGEDLIKKKKKGAIDKWYKDEKNAPDNKEVVIIVETLRKIAGIPNYLTGEKKNDYGAPPKPYLVWVPIDLELAIADYNGFKPPLSFIKMEEKMGIVLYRNTSKHEADGEFFVGQSGMTTRIDPSTRIAIKRINKALWKPSRYYVIIDTAKEVSICELLPGDDEKTVKLVFALNPKGPHRAFPLEEIMAIFTIVDGNWIPTPPRDHEVIANSQQPNTLTDYSLEK